MIWLRTACRNLPGMGFLQSRTRSFDCGPLTARSKSDHLSSFIYLFIKLINFVFKSHRQMWWNIPYDFGHMIERLAANRGASADFLREVIWAQRVHFPALVVD